MHRKFNFYAGRWAPFHSGHKHIIQEALDNGENVCVAIRDTEISEFDPYTVAEREEMIAQSFKTEMEEGRVCIIKIPDISAISIGRKVGYAVNRYDPPENIKGISATGIRKAMGDGDPSWKEVVPEGTIEFFESREGQVLWFTGPSGAGKSTIAQLAAKQLELMGKKVKVLDGDELRKGISNNLGLSPEDRTEHNRRVACMAKAITDVGGICIVALISPYKANRDTAREIIGGDKFQTVYIKSTKDLRIERDPKGLYKRAIAGEITGLTGYDGDYDDPTETGEGCSVIDTEVLTPEECAARLVEIAIP